MDYGWSTMAIPMLNLFWMCPSCVALFTAHSKLPLYPICHHPSYFYFLLPHCEYAQFYLCIERRHSPSHNLICPRSILTWRNMRDKTETASPMQLTSLKLIPYDLKVREVKSNQLFLANSPQTGAKTVGCNECVASLSLIFFLYWRRNRKKRSCKPTSGPPLWKMDLCSWEVLRFVLNWIEVI